MCRSVRTGADLLETAALLGQIACDISDMVKVYYCGKVNREIAKYYSGDPVMQKRDIFGFFIFSTQSIYDNFFEKCRKSA